MGVATALALGAAEGAGAGAGAGGLLGTLGGEAAAGAGAGLGAEAVGAGAAPTADVLGAAYSPLGAEGGAFSAANMADPAASIPSAPWYQQALKMMAPGLGVKSSLGGQQGGQQPQSFAPPPGRSQAGMNAGRSLTTPSFDPKSIGGVATPGGPHYSVMSKGTGDPRLAMLRLLMGGR